MDQVQLHPMVIAQWLASATLSMFWPILDWSEFHDARTHVRDVMCVHLSLNSIVIVCEYAFPLLLANKHSLFLPRLITLTNDL